MIDKDELLRKEAGTLQKPEKKGEEVALDE